MKVDPITRAWKMAGDIPEPDFNEISGESSLGSTDAVCVASKSLLYAAKHEVPLLYAYVDSDDCQKFLDVRLKFRKRVIAIGHVAQRLRGKWAQANLKTHSSDTEWHGHHFGSAHLALYAWCRAQLFMILAAADADKLLRSRAGDQTTFEVDDLRAQWPNIRKVFSTAWEDPGQLVAMIEAERDAVLDMMVAPQRELDGPVPGFRWRRDGEVTKAPLAPSAWRLANHLFHCPSKSADYATLAPIVADDHSETMLDATNCRGHRDRANDYFKKHAIPWRISLRGQPALVADE